MDVLKSILEVLSVINRQELVLNNLEDIFLQLEVDFLEKTSQLRCDFLLDFLVHVFSLGLHLLLKKQSALVQFCTILFLVLMDAFLQVSYLSLQSVDQLTVIVLGSGQSGEFLFDEYPNGFGVDPFLHGGLARERLISFVVGKRGVISLFLRLDVCKNGSPFEHGARQVGVPPLGLVPRSSVHAIIRHIN